MTLFGVLQVEWNKGHALSHLLHSLSLSNADDVLPIYIGDDRTDEDAFAVLSENGKGIGILVSTKVFPLKTLQFNVLRMRLVKQSS